MLSPGYVKFEMVIWLIICILGTIGNVLVVLVVYCQRKMKTVTNQLIVNLAFADLAVLLLNIPADVAVTLNNGSWLYGKFMCHVLRPIQTMATTASVWSLVTISISRYVAIVHPLKPQLRKTHARWTIVPVWGVSFVLVSPYMASLKMKDDRCVDDFDAAGMSSKYYTLGLFITQYVIPLAIMAFSYMKVAQELTTSTSQDERTRTYYKETRKVLKMLVVVMIVFAILVLPVHIVYIWLDFFNGKENKYFEEIYSMAAIMVYMNSFANPIIYNVCHEEFRKSFRSYCGMLIKPCAHLMYAGQMQWNMQEFNTTLQQTRSSRKSSASRELNVGARVCRKDLDNNLCDLKETENDKMGARSKIKKQPDHPPDTGEIRKFNPKRYTVMTNNKIAFARKSNTSD